MKTFLLVVALLVGCKAPPVVDAPVPAIDPTRLSHDQHARIACTSCHTMGSPRPGHDHKPCDECHRAAFMTTPGPLCKVCHLAITTNPLDAPLRLYPAVDDIWQAEPPRFSHQRHLDATRVEASVGFHVGCPDCHLGGDGKLVRPGHAICARCHAPETKLAHAPNMDDCAGCHAKGAQQRTRARLIRGDLHFDHDHHRTDRRGTQIRCEQCHTRSATAVDYASHPPPTIESCVGCHDDSDRTPNTLRMRVCEACHAERTLGLTTLAPRNHLPATERPLDHTLAFRRDHSDAAERDAARCATCHTQMSGNAHAACDECHQTMRPADHRITWRELDHGQEAAADRSRCARCHVIEFCTACHSQRPRSHGFPGSFAGGEHAMLARVNVRACLTCHVETTDCTKSGCHGTVAPR